MMKTIQMTIDEGLLDRIDRAVLELGTNRSAFIRNAVENALRQLRVHQLEAQHVAGYERQPLPAGEIEEWDAIRAWGDA